MPKLTQQELETYLWGAANILRGKTAGQDYKTYILTLLFFKRLSDQWDYEADEVIREKEAEFGRTLNEKQHQALRATAHVHRFRIPEGAHWGDVRAVSENIGEVLTAATLAIAKGNPELTGVFTVDWNQPAPDGLGGHLKTDHRGSLQNRPTDIPLDKNLFYLGDCCFGNS
ncbi:MAG: type I restriction-modification system subunit M N-terminal domain-containing protein [Acidobacteria bacterium]|nr:type I restriction-modification system subunit M N-terminal domain-containing protein [Acidobacteriota bacterium]